MVVTLSGTPAMPSACVSISLIAAPAARTALRLNSMSMPASFSSWSCVGSFSAPCCWAGLALSSPAAATCSDHQDEGK